MTYDLNSEGIWAAMLYEIALPILIILFEVWREDWNQRYKVASPLLFLTIIQCKQLPFFYTLPF